MSSGAGTGASTASADLRPIRASTSRSNTSRRRAAAVTWRRARAVSPSTTGEGRTTRRWSLQSPKDLEVVAVERDLIDGPAVSGGHVGRAEHQGSGECVDASRRGEHLHDVDGVRSVAQPALQLFGGGVEAGTDLGPEVGDGDDEQVDVAARSCRSVRDGAVDERTLDAVEQGEHLLYGPDDLIRCGDHASLHPAGPASGLGGSGVEPASASRSGGVRSRAVSTSSPTAASIWSTVVRGLPGQAAITVKVRSGPSPTRSSRSRRVCSSKHTRPAR